MKQVFSKSGQIVIEEVPPPFCPEGHLLIKNAYSLISSGTERLSLGGSSEGLVTKALKRPDLVKKVIGRVIKEGLSKTAGEVREKIQDVNPLGYSSAGHVIEIGNQTSGFMVGDQVACAGVGYASHAEIVSVPKNLVVKVPTGVKLKNASFVTLGSIAMQGVRRARAEVGETFVVIGLGLIGQLVAQILRIAGCRVIGIDIDKARVELAESLGLDIGIVAVGEKDYIDQVMEHTNGIGADAVIISAATKSSEPANSAFKMARKKGRIVVVGAVGMNLDREDFYHKELDFLISTSYGPGRYDKNYEEKGLDYPIGYVRWTENRNMQEFMYMLANKKINVEELIDYEFEIDSAGDAYKTLIDKNPLGIMLKYPLEEIIEKKITIHPQPTDKDVLNVAIIGAGSFARVTHLPNLAKIDECRLRAIVTGTGVNAKQLAEKHRAAYASSDYKEILADSDIDVVLVATRHDLHAKIAVEAAKARKDIFMEKPMALNQKELEEVIKAITENKVNFTVGFNRRFSPLSAQAKEVLEHRKYPIAMTYRVNAGSLSPDHWVNDPIVGGGRIVGEVCHFLDLMYWFAQSPIKDIGVKSLSSEDAFMESDNNVSVSIKFENGSIGNLLYTTLGASSFPKERLEIFSDSLVIVIDDFKELQIFNKDQKKIRLKIQDKGHLQELIVFFKQIKGISGNSVSLDEAVSITDWTFRINEALHK